eukprot:3493976-Prymnesium_polylepis.1
MAVAGRGEAIHARAACSQEGNLAALAGPPGQANAVTDRRVTEARRVAAACAVCGGAAERECPRVPLVRRRFGRTAEQHRESGAQGNEHARARQERLGHCHCDLARS